jgi:methylamine dehydrogenase accessory protein MauD
MLVSLIISQIVSWIVIAALVVALLALARQVGVLHMRVAPAGALTTAGGPAVGSGSPLVEAHDIEGGHVTIGGPNKASPLRLLMFVSAACPLCKGLIPVAKSFAQAERLNLTFVGDDDAPTQRRFVGQAFGVGKLPYAVLLDQEGVVLSKGLVNSREHLESLVIAHEMGVRSVQDYIGSLKAIA